MKPSCQPNRKPVSEEKVSYNADHLTGGAEAETTILKDGQDHTLSRDA